MNHALLLVYVMTIIVSTPVIYVLTRNQVYSQSERELTLLVDMLTAAKLVVQEDTSPHFVPQGVYFPTVVSSSVMAKSVASKFARTQPDYYIKVASDDPFNPEDLPEPLEVKLLETFRQTGVYESIVERGKIQDNNFLVSASPSIASDSCLVCHGERENAPEVIKAAYTKEDGYNWVSGSVVGANVVGVPVESVNTIVLRRFLILLAGLSLIFGLLFVIINRLIRRRIIIPVTNITKIAVAVSKGDIDTGMKTNRNDEIGDLVKAFELMRHSLKLSLERLKKN